MSKFYGQVFGMSDTSASRRGARNITVSAQSYDGSVVTTLYYDDDKLCVRIALDDDSTCIGNTMFEGTFDELFNLFQLHKDIENKNVSITRHRAKSNKMKALEKLFNTKGE